MVCVQLFLQHQILALEKANFGLIYGNARLFVVTVLAIVFTVTWSDRDRGCRWPAGP